MFSLQKNDCHTLHFPPLTGRTFKKVDDVKLAELRKLRVQLHVLAEFLTSASVDG